MDLFCIYMKIDFQTFLEILRYKLLISNTPVSSVDETCVTFWYPYTILDQTRLIQKF